MSDFNLKEADIEYMSDVLGNGILKRMSPATRLAGLSVEECLSGLSVEERLKGLSAEECLKGFSIEEIWTHLPQEEKQKLMELALADEE